MFIISGREIRWVKLGLLVLALGLVFGVKFATRDKTASPTREASAAPTNWTNMTVRIPPSDKVVGDLNITNSTVLFEAPVNGDYATLTVNGNLDIKSNSTIYTGETALIGLYNNDRAAHPGLAGGTTINIEVTGDVTISGTIDARFANNINITSNSDRNGGMTLPGAKGGSGGIPFIKDDTDDEASGGAGGGNGGGGTEGIYSCWVNIQANVCAGGAGGGGGFQGYGGLVGQDTENDNLAEAGTPGNSASIRSRQATIATSLAGSISDPVKALTLAGGIGGRVDTNNLYPDYQTQSNIISSGGGSVVIKAGGDITFNTSTGKIIANGIAGMNSAIVNSPERKCFSALGGGSGGNVYIKARSVTKPTIDVRGAPGGNGGDLVYSGGLNPPHCRTQSGGGGGGGVVILDTSNISNCNVRGVREDGYFSSDCTRHESADVVSDTISEGTNINPSYKPDSGDILLRGGYAGAVGNKLLANAGVIVFPSLVPSGGGFAQIEKHTYNNQTCANPETATFNSGDKVCVKLIIKNPVGLSSATVTDEIPSGAGTPHYITTPGGTLAPLTSIITWNSISLSGSSTEIKYYFTMP